MGHYFINDPDLESERRVFSYRFLTTEIKIISDRGIFAKNRVDTGTDILLREIPSPKGNSRILDVGCGYGVIGLSLAKAYPASHVDMIDINERAVRLTQDAIKLNKIPNAKAFVSDLFENVKGSYDIIITNPPIRAGKKVVYAIIDLAYRALNGNGMFYAVILKKQGAPSFIVKLNSVFGEAVVLKKKKGYYVLAAKKKI